MPSAAPPVDLSDDDDPVTAEYDIYLTSPLSQYHTTTSTTPSPNNVSSEAETSLYLLQFPTRDREGAYTHSKGNEPLGIRIKPNSHFLELDVPINQSFYYDHNKAKVWGSALNKAKTEGAAGFGLAAGFAQNAAVRGGAPQNVELNRVKSQSVAPNSPAGSRPGSRAGRQGSSASVQEVDPDKMRHQTLGGQIIPSQATTKPGQGGGPQYMIGAFRGSELHLTPLDGMVQMRPQFHHLDAQTQVDRNATRRTRAADEASGREPARVLEPRLVQLTAKAAGDPESAGETTGENTKAYLSAAEQEVWRKLRWTDEDEEEAFEKYHDMLFLTEDTGEDSKRGLDAEKIERRREERGRKLKARMGNDQYLDIISAPRLDPSSGSQLRPTMRKVNLKREVIDDDDEEEEGLFVDESSPSGAADAAPMAPMREDAEVVEDINELELKKSTSPTMPRKRKSISPKAVKKEPKGKGKAKATTANGGSVDDPDVSMMDA
jgi:DNA-directed RNA polymerase-3 subunit RPC5